MTNRFFWISILGMAISFVGGFLVANSLNRSQMNQLVAENSQIRNGGSNSKVGNSTPTLTREEIESRLKQAEENPSDFAFQRSLGLALYRYAAKMQDEELLVEVATLLGRAHSINPDDYQVMVSYGNVSFDLGQIKKSSERNSKAREIYEKALKKNPNDVNVIADYGLTFLLTDKKDLNRASAELKRALEKDPKYERALQYMTQTQIELGNSAAAKEYLSRLKAVSPKNIGLAALEAKIAK